MGLLAWRREEIVCPSRAPVFLERDGRKTVSKRETRDNEKAEWDIGVLL